MVELIKKLVNFFKTLFSKKKLKEVQIEPPKDETKRLTYTKRTN